MFTKGIYCVAQNYVALKVTHHLTSNSTEQILYYMQRGVWSQFLTKIYFIPFGGPRLFRNPQFLETEIL